MVLDNTKKQWKHHSSGVFTNPIKRTSFAFDEEEGTISADIIRIDARFTSLLRWLGENISMYAYPVKTERMDMPYIRFVRSRLVAEPNCRQRTVFCSL